MELQNLFGLPAHPFLVHIPVVLVPLAAIGALLALVVPRWRDWLLPTTAVLAGGALVGVQLAIGSGEGLQEITGTEEGISNHVHLAEQSRPVVFLFFLAAAAAAYLWWNHRHVEAGTGGTSALTKARPGLNRALVPVLTLSLVLGVLSSVWIVRTGHTGAESVWKDKVTREQHEGGGGELPANAPQGGGDADAN